VISAESLGSLSSWSISAVRTSCPVTRARPRRSAASRCQMSRARCWPGERSTVRRVFGLRVRPMAKESVGAAATEGVSGVTAASCMRDRWASALPRLLSELISDLQSREPNVSISVDQFSISVHQQLRLAVGKGGKRVRASRLGATSTGPMTEKPPSWFPTTGRTIRIRRWIATGSCSAGILKRNIRRRIVAVFWSPICS
jgi:hypothetical protein